jgi:hypothetical protein
VSAVPQRLTRQEALYLACRDAKFQAMLARWDAKFQSMLAIAPTRNLFTGMVPGAGRGPALVKIADAIGCDRIVTHTPARRRYSVYTTRCSVSSFRAQGSEAVDLPACRPASGAVDVDFSLATPATLPSSPCVL